MATANMPPKRPPAPADEEALGRASRRDFEAFVPVRKAKALPQVPPQAMAEEAAKKDARFRVAREMVETERSYLAGLEILDRYYQYPMRKGVQTGKRAPRKGEVIAFPYVIKKHDVLVIFSSLSDILQATKVMLPRLEAAVPAQGSGPISVGQVFANSLALLDSYRVYCRGSEAAIALVARNLAKKERFKTFCDAQKVASGSVLDINALMITPVQRLPRYLMLLQELRKSTPLAEIQEMNGLDASIAGVRELLDGINRAVADAAAGSEGRLELLQRSFVSTSDYGQPVDIVAPTRRWIRESTPTMLTAGTSRELVSVRVILLNDMIVIAEPLDDSDRLRQRDVIPFSFIESLTRMPDPPGLWRLARRVGEPLDFLEESASACEAFVRDYERMSAELNVHRARAALPTPTPAHMPPHTSMATHSAPALMALATNATESSAPVPSADVRTESLVGEKALRDRRPQSGPTESTSAKTSARPIAKAVVAAESSEKAKSSYLGKTKEPSPSISRGPQNPPTNTTAIKASSKKQETTVVAASAEPTSQGKVVTTRVVVKTGASGAGKKNAAPVNSNAKPGLAAAAVSPRLEKDKLPDGPAKAAGGASSSVRSEKPSDVQTATAKMGPHQSATHVLSLEEARRLIQTHPMDEEELTASLSDDALQSATGIPRAAFLRLKPWRRAQLFRDAGLLPPRSTS